MFGWFLLVMLCYPPQTHPDLSDGVMLAYKLGSLAPKSVRKDFERACRAQGYLRQDETLILDGHWFAGAMYVMRGRITGTLNEGDPRRKW